MLSATGLARCVSHFLKDTASVAVCVEQLATALAGVAMLVLESGAVLLRGLFGQ
jgi:hypothetical protein